MGSLKKPKGREKINREEQISKHGYSLKVLETYWFNEKLC